MLQYAAWYKAVYEMSPGDKPDQATINDDIALDAWWKRYQRDMAKKHAELKRGQQHSNAGANWTMPIVGEDA